MIPLDDPRWAALAGGYRLPYDASVPLRALEAATDADAERAAWNELWEDLYHQGDIGSAAYYAVPHVVRIAASRPTLSADPFAFVAAVEVARARPENPPLPLDVALAYHESLASVLTLVATHSDQAWDVGVTAAVFSAVAAAKGHAELSLATAELDPTTTRAFLAQQTGYQSEEGSGFGSLAEPPTT